MYEKKDIKNTIILILVASACYWGVNNLSIITNLLTNFFQVLSPFILGALIAFVLNIPMTKIEKFLLTRVKNKKNTSKIRIIAIMFSLLLLILIVGFVAFLLVPELIHNIELLIETIPTLINNLESFILNLLDQYPDIQKQLATVFKENTNTSTIISNALNYLVSSAITLVSSLVSGIIMLFTAVIFSIYILSQKEYLKRGSQKLIYAYLKKRQADKIVEASKLANTTFTKFISGQCLEAVILGSIFFVVLSLFQFPYALLISVLTTVTALVPIFGAIIAMVIGAILIAITSPFQALIFIIIFQVIQQIEGNFIYPRVVGKSVGLSPMWTLLAISVGGSLFGIPGMLFALPITSILYEVVKFDANNKLAQKKLITK